MLEIEHGMQLSKTAAILRYVGTKYGMYSTDPVTMIAIDQLVEFGLEVVGELTEYAQAAK